MNSLNLFDPHPLPVLSFLFLMFYFSFVFLLITMILFLSFYFVLVSKASLEYRKVLEKEPCVFISYSAGVHLSFVCYDGWASGDIWHANQNLKFNQVIKWNCVRFHSRLIPITLLLQQLFWRRTAAVMQNRHQIAVRSLPRSNSRFRFDCSG